MTADQERLLERTAICHVEANLSLRDAMDIAARGYAMEKARKASIDAEGGSEAIEALYQSALKFLRSQEHDWSGLGVRRDVDLMARMAG